ncbi:MAG TPA: hypothetical protein VNJ09_03195 [Chthonomonadales bacterium]|nr:hypothetical protein [Chthonomonadales bacterium]
MHWKLVCSYRPDPYSIAKPEPDGQYEYGSYPPHPIISHLYKMNDRHLAPCGCRSFVNKLSVKA